MKITAALLALLVVPAVAKPLPVYILCGQSNMQGHAHIRTMDVMALDPETAPLLEKMRGKDGDPTVCDDIFISSIGSSDGEKFGQLTAGYGPEKGGPKIGPEFTFGLTLQEHLDGPALIIKTAWGGKSLHTDFRPPSAGPYPFRDDEIERLLEKSADIDQIKADKAEATGHYYRLMLDHVKHVLGDIKRVYPGYDASDGYQLSGFVWFQGWNDMVAGGFYQNRGQPGSYDAYSDALAHFIRDVRKDLEAPELPFVIGVMGAGGPIDQYPPEKQRYAGIHGEFRKAMAAPADLPEFKGNVTAVWTDQYWDMELERIRARDREIQNAVKAQVKDGTLAKADERSTIETHRSKAFTERQLNILNNGASNAEYHYLGSAKILGRIGQAFAEALLE